MSGNREKSVRVLNKSLCGIVITGLALALNACGKTEPSNSTARKADTATTNITTTQTAPVGKELYETYCLACHQANGSGVPGMQPALTGSNFLAGEKSPLIRFLLTGERIPPSGGDWLGVMAAFDHLSDAELAAILSYSRLTFTNTEIMVTTDEVAEIRNTLGE